MVSFFAPISWRVFLPRVAQPACVMYCRSTENDSNPCRTLADVVHHQCLLIGGATDDENDDIQRSASHESSDRDKRKKIIGEFSKKNI